MFHDEFWKLIYFGSKGQRSRSRVTKTVRRWSLHSCERLLLLVMFNYVFFGICVCRDYDEYTDFYYSAQAIGYHGVIIRHLV